MILWIVLVYKKLHNNNKIKKIEFIILIEILNDH